MSSSRSKCSSLQGRTHTKKEHSSPPLPPSSPPSAPSSCYSNTARVVDVMGVLMVVVLTAAVVVPVMRP